MRSLQLSWNYSSYFHSPDHSSSQILNIREYNYQISSFLKSKNRALPCTTCSCSVTQSCPILGNLTDCTLPGSSAHGISQSRLLQWVVIPFSRGSSQSRDQTWVSCIAGWFFLPYIIHIICLHYQNKVPHIRWFTRFVFSILDDISQRSRCWFCLSSLSWVCKWLSIPLCSYDFASVPVFKLLIIK